MTELDQCFPFKILSSFFVNIFLYKIDKWHNVYNFIAIFLIYFLIFLDEESLIFFISILFFFLFLHLISHFFNASCLVSRNHMCVSTVLSFIICTLMEPHLYCFSLRIRSIFLFYSSCHNIIYIYTYIGQSKHFHLSHVLLSLFLFTSPEIPSYTTSLWSHY